MEELSGFEYEISDCLDFAPSARVDAAVSSAVRRQALMNRWMRVLSMPSRIPLAAMLAVLVGVGSVLYYRSEAKRVAVEEYSQALLEVQGLADDDYLASFDCVELI